MLLVQAQLHALTVQTIYVILAVTSAKVSSLHYANIPILYTTKFHGCKNDNFQMKKFIIFLIFAQNIDCGYTLEPPQ